MLEGVVLRACVRVGVTPVLLSANPREQMNVASQPHTLDTLWENCEQNNKGLFLKEAEDGDS